MLGLGAGELALLALAALLVGLAKGALPGAGAISVALFAVVLPARESTGALLPLLVVGDLVTVAMYRRSADWGVLLRLMPAVVVGVAAGVVFVGRVDDDVMRRTIGAVLLLLVVVSLVQRRLAGTDGDAPARADGAGEGRRGSRTAAGGFGVLAGFTTMVANAGGPVMSLYLLRTGLPVLGFLGTAAWFFLVLNLVKLPFSVGLGLVDADALRLCALLAPAVLVGALGGRLLAGRISQRGFEVAVLVLTTVAALQLLR